MITKMKNNKYISFALILFLAGCSLSPGMHMTSKSLDKNNVVFIESLNQNLIIQDISDAISIDNSVYKIGNGDQISITVWGLPDIFPVSNINPDQNLRRVDSNGNIYFPYVGIIKASEKTQDELRTDLSRELSKNFNSPQLDVSVARFNSQKVYILGEVTKPMKINITDITLSLSDVLGEVGGLNTNTSNGSEVYVIRQAISEGMPSIYKADLSSPSGFIDSGKFTVMDNDIVYVNAKGTTRWNRVVSQFFPFSTFLNSIDNLTSD